MGDNKERVLTWLQTAVKVKDDHKETPQTQGKNQPDHFWFSHAEGSGGPGEPNRLRLDFQTVVLSTLSPIKASIQRADLCHSGSWRASLGVQAAVKKSGLGPISRLAEPLRAGRNRARLHRPGGPTGGHWERLWSALGKFRGGLSRLFHFLTPFSPSINSHFTRLAGNGDFRSNLLK